MRLQDKGSTAVYNVPQAIGQKLVAAGLAVEVPDTPKPIQAEPTAFDARPGQRLGDYEYPPRVFYSCPVCKSAGYVQNVTDNFVFRHCAGRADKIPNTIREDYDRLLAKYRFRGRKAPTGLVDDRVLDRALATVRGVKSREELTADIRLANKKG
ncbi:MAG: hypothetical protein WBQ89_01185 [Candidatus Acidiferrum sp.]